MSQRSGHFVVILALAVAGSMNALGAGGATFQSRQYRDPNGRFTFDYPAAFGQPETGTDSGFGGRVAAIRFTTFSTQDIGGEAVLVQGPPAVSVLALGGLYDDITIGALPEAVTSAVASVLPRLTGTNFCEQLRAERHVDVSAPAFAKLPAAQREAVASLDAMGHVAPRVFRCDVTGDVVTFHKEAGLAPGSARRHAYGAVRFLSGPYSAFYLVRAGQTPATGVIAEMMSVVRSWRAAAGPPLMRKF